jgi:wyosine [tRNA(Phe)-imidazoG37] synthetase (radical SAM superfamily)
MATILRKSYIFGPVKSRRLGISLGINILPIEKKICNFNCIYCECGWNSKKINDNVPQNLLSFPRKEIIKLELESVLTRIKNNGEMLNVITFSGNGEPTLHPNFAEIIDDTLELRNKFIPNTQIAVLSNSTNLEKNSVIDALKKIDKPILKLDSSNIDTFEKMNMHGINNNKTNGKKITIEKIIEGMKKIESNFIFQTMFLRGEINGDSIDNTTDLEIDGLINIMKETKPKQVMIYPIDRDSPVKKLVKLDRTEMKKIATIIENNGLNVLYV